MSRILKRITTGVAIAGVAALVLAAGGVGTWLFLTRGRESTDDAQIDGSVTQIGSRIGGTVLHVRIVDHQTVKSGDVLVEIDPRDYQLSADKARAELADADANEGGQSDNGFLQVVLCLVLMAIDCCIKGGIISLGRFPLAIQCHSCLSRLVHEVKNYISRRKKPLNSAEVLPHAFLVLKELLIFTSHARGKCVCEASEG